MVNQPTDIMKSTTLNRLLKLMANSALWAKKQFSSWVNKIFPIIRHLSEHITGSFSQCSPVWELLPEPRKGQALLVDILTSKFSIYKINFNWFYKAKMVING